MSQTGLAKELHTEFKIARDGAHIAAILRCHQGRRQSFAGVRTNFEFDEAHRPLDREGRGLRLGIIPDDLLASISQILARHSDLDGS